jgi:hypothetical protein
MMDHDAERALGRYPQAAWHMLQAGEARARMGQMMFDAGQFAQAAADWLSAAACFYLATGLERMRNTFERVKQLGQEGKIPPERRDIHAAIKERAEQLETLARKIAQFHETRHASDQESLDWLLTQLRELPGLPELHSAIAQIATRLGQTARASENLTWAEKFAPDARVAEIHPASTNGASKIHPASAENSPTS